MVDIFFSGICPVFDLPHPGTGRHFNALHSIADQRFDFILHAVRQLIAIPVKKLNAVELHRIMGCGNHDSGFHLIFLCQISHCRCGNHTHIYRVGPYAADSRHQRIRQHIPRNTGIAAYHDSRPVFVLFCQYCCPCLPKLHSQQRGQFLICHSAHTIRAK